MGPRIGQFWSLGEQNKNVHVLLYKEVPITMGDVEYEADKWRWKFLSVTCTFIVRDAKFLFFLILC